jgi:oligoendopeptidase F
MAANAYEQKRWSLRDLFPSIDAPELAAARAQLSAQTKAFEAMREKLAPELPEAQFLEILQRYEDITRALARLGYFGHLSFAADTQDQHVQALLAQVQQWGAEIENRTMFLKLWWKSLDEEAAQRLMGAAGDYRYWLEALRLEIPYTLTEPEERIINLKDVNGAAALVTLYDSITNRYVFHLTVDGEEKELTRGELAVYVRHPDADLRQAAYQEMLRTYEIDATILGQLYQFLVRDWRSENVDVRGYKMPISVRNLSNDIPDQVVDTLLNVCQQNRGIFHRYFALKAKWLKMPQIRRYDVYAPVVESSVRYPFGEGCAMVLESFAQFDGRVAELAGQVLAADHLDSEVRKGKRSGAFCATVEPALTPWVLVNYQGQPDDVATLAHELGHAVHSLLAADHSALTQGPCLPLAETASTFGEMLLIDHLLAGDPDPELQRSLLFKQMDDAYGTIMRQAYFALFERAAHERVHQGGAVDDLSALYFENLADQFGDALDLSEDFRYEWVAIPHFYHSPFYVYAYAFGQLLVLALYQQYRQEGHAFKPRYFDILAAGGSLAPVRILDRAGVDVRTEEFWQGGFDVLAAALQRLEELEPPA